MIRQFGEMTGRLPDFVFFFSLNTPGILCYGGHIRTSYRTCFLCYSVFVLRLLRGVRCTLLTIGKGYNMALFLNLFPISA